MALLPLRRLSILGMSCGLLALGLALGWIAGIVDPPRAVVAERCEAAGSPHEAATPARGGGLDSPGGHAGRWHRLLPGMFR